MPDEREGSIKLYIDGALAAQTFGSLTVVTDQHDLQAVEVKERSKSDAVFLASSSNGVRSDSQWRCTDIFYDGWFFPSYDDSSWLRANVVTYKPGAPHLAPDAEWIGYISGSKKIFCRRNTTLGKEIYILHAILQIGF